MGFHAEKQAALESAASINSNIIHKGKFISVRRDEIDIRIVPFDEALKLIEDGTICDAKTALGILRIGRPL